MKYRKETRRQSLLFAVMVIVFAISLAIAFISLPAPAEAATPNVGRNRCTEVRSRAWEPVINVVGR